jgi:hypothetical protein
MLDAAFWEERSRSMSSEAGRQQKHIEARQEKRAVRGWRRCGGDGSGRIFWIIFRRRGVIIGCNYATNLIEIGLLISDEIDGIGEVQPR